MAKRKKTKRKITPITFLDLGSGPFAKYGWRLADNRKDRKNKGKFISVDKKRQVLVTTRNRLIGQSHHSFEQMDVFESLRKKRNGSVKVVNDEGLLDQLVMKQLKHSTTTNFEMPLELANEKIRKYVSEIFRVLKKNGRSFIVVKSGISKIILRAMRNAGFEILSVREVKDEEILKGTSDYLKAEVKNRPQILQSSKELIRLMPQQVRMLGFNEQVRPEDIIKTVRISIKKP